MHQPPTAATEWRAHWLLVVASMIGISQAPIAVTSIGLFMQPLSDEFGWTRAQIASGLTIIAFIGVPLGPVIGTLVDRWGARRLAIPGVILTGAVIASFGLLSGSLIQWWGQWLLYGVVALAIKTTVWTAAISSVFHTSRGLALGIALCGTSIASAGVPIIAEAVIEDMGWRVAYGVLGLGWAAVILLFVIPFFRDARDHQRSAAAAGGAAATFTPRGLTIPQAIRDRSLQKLALALLLLCGLLVAISVHFVPMLTQQGMSRATAAGLAAMLGASAILGKLTTGWLIDRLPVGAVAGTIFALPAVPCLIFLLVPGSVPIAMVAAIVLGMCSGAYLHACTYITSRLAGLLNFGAIFGFMGSLMSLMLGTTPLLAGAVFDAYGTYAPVLIAGIPICLLCGLLVSTIRAFPDWSPRPA